MPDRAEFFADGGLNVGQRVVKDVADAVIDQVAEFFDWVEFRAVGRQRKNTVVRGLLFERGLGVLIKACLIPDHHMHRVGIARAELHRKAWLIPRLTPSANMASAKPSPAISSAA